VKILFAFIIFFNNKKVEKAFPWNGDRGGETTDAETTFSNNKKRRFSCFQE